METAANRLQKEAKGYLDSLRGGWLVRKTDRWMQISSRLILPSHDGVSNAYCGDY